MDLVKLETARRILEVGLQSGLLRFDERLNGIGAVMEAANSLHAACAGEQSGHPAETALEQLFDLLASHEDKLLCKWVKANAKRAGLKELCSYLGAERDAG